MTRLTKSVKDQSAQIDTMVPKISKGLVHDLCDSRIYVNTWFAQGMVDGSASKPALRQDTGYMVEKTYLDIAPYVPQ